MTTTRTALYVCVCVLLGLTALAHGDVLCAQSGPCKCSSSAGEINLSPLDNPSNPLPWQQPGAVWTYQYNPCTGFTCGTTVNSAVCEKYTAATITYGLGAASSATFKFDAATSQNYIEYSQAPYTSQVYLVCDQTQNGRITSGPNGPMGNMYTFRLASKYCCPGAAGGAGGLSPGSVLLIIFFSLLAAYLIGGVLFLHFVKHENGINMVPNYQLWIQVPGLIRDGSVLSYSTIVALVSGKRDEYATA